MAIKPEAYLTELLDRMAVRVLEAREHFPDNSIEVAKAIGSLHYLIDEARAAMGLPAVETLERPDLLADAVHAVIAASVARTAETEEDLETSMEMGRV
jgi:hypothetical protein